METLDKKGVRIAYIRVMQDMCEGVSTSVRIQGGDIDDFPIIIGFIGLG